MELSVGCVWKHAVSSFEALAITVALVIASMAYFGASGKLWKGGKKQPPLAPGGMWKHIQMATSSQFPWWMLDVTRQLQSQVFKVSLPLGLGTQVFIVGEPEVARSILTDQLSTKPEVIYGNIGNVVGGNTLFTLNGPSWHSKRKATAPAFSSNQIKRMTKVALEKTDAWIESTLINSNCDSGFDVGQEMVRIVLSAISETAFEYKMSTQEQEYFRNELKLSLIEFAVKSPTNPLRRMFGWFVPERIRAFTASKNLIAMILKIMDAYRNKEHLQDGTIIQLVMESDAFPTDDEKASQLLEFLLAGHDTTAYSISWILLCIARNAKEQTELRECLSKLSPMDWTSSDHLKRNIKEGMRLYPVAPTGAARTIGRDFMTSRSEILPKGSICYMPNMLLFRDPSIFEDPGSFQPSRWIKPSKEMSAAFIPFTLGKQNCIGQSLANAETFSIIARICSEFELSLESEGSVDFFLTLKPVGARLKARKICSM